MKKIALPSALLLLLLAAPGHGAEPDTPRLGVRLLPFTGVTVPHQQIARFGVAAPVAFGLEVYYTPAFSLALDLSSSWHSDGNADMQLSSMQILGRWRFPRQGWTPFAQAGVGGYQAAVDEGGHDKSLGGVGVTVGGGVEVPVWEAIHLQVELRSNWAQAQASQGGGDPWIGHTQALLWAVYKLP